MYLWTIMIRASVVVVVVVDDDDDDDCSGFDDDYDAFGSRGLNYSRRRIMA
jgi:hypothetical protein